MARGRRKRRRIGIGLMIIEFILGLVILAAILGAAAYFLCPLKSVKVKGTDLYTPEEIQGYILDDKYSSNAVYAFLKNKFMPKGDAEFIESFEVKLTGMNSVTIQCNEKPILGYVYEEDGKLQFLQILIQHLNLLTMFEPSLSLLQQQPTLLTGCQ